MSKHRLSGDQKAHLHAQLLKIEKEFRGSVNAYEFRDYILGFIFYKYLSEKMQVYATGLLKGDGIAYADIDPATETGQKYLSAIETAAIKQLGYFLKPDELFSALAKKGRQAEDSFILGDLTKVLTGIERSTTGAESEDCFDRLFEDLDLSSTKLGLNEKDKNSLIVKILTHLDDIDIALEDTELDVLGDAYEYLIGRFAVGARKKAGEFYTPQEVSKVLAKLVTVGKTQLKSVYDPTCGSGSLLLRVAKEVDMVADYCGQELNRTTYNLARMNMIMHDVHYRDFDIKQADTLEQPQHMDKRFEAIVANPPFSVNWSASNLLLTDSRFSPYGKLAPKSKADYAFITHMLHHLTDDGTMAVVMPHGVLFRGAAEGHIRAHIIKEMNCLDAVIGLPANIFYGTSIPTCILVFKKQRTHAGDILFIDASNAFDKVKTQNILREDHIEKILSTYQHRETTDKYSYVAPLSEVEENDYNLNIPRYVDTFEEEDPIDINAVALDIRALDHDMVAIDEKLKSFCKELGIEAPF